MINIAKILKDAPQGLKLHCTMVGECELSYNNGKEIVIKYNKKDETLAALTLDEFGRFSENGDCVLFPTSSNLYWENWQANIFLKNKGLVVIDKSNGYRFVISGYDGYEYALCNVFGEMATNINTKDCIFADEDCSKRFFEHLRDNGYEYKEGNVIPIEKICKPEKGSRNDYKKIIEHYGVRNQLKKLSDEVYELKEAVIEEYLLCGVNGCNNKNITEEIADVCVILRQLVMQFDIAENDIEDMADYKVKRTLERIEKGM